MKETTCVKVKDGKLKKIKDCSLSNIRKLNNQGFSVSKVITEGNHTSIETFSPLTKGQARGIAKAKGFPFN